MIFSVIIPTCNRSDLLSSCLNLIKSESELNKKFAHEIIVSDDSHDQITKQLIDNHYSWANWTQGPKRGPAANRNQGAKQANGEWLVFLDDDCLPQPGWLKAYLELILSDAMKATVLEGKTVANGPKSRFDEEAPINITGNKLWSCNFAIKKSVFQEVEGFDESFPYAAMEDVDFFERVQKKAVIAFVHDAVVIHPWRIIKPFVNFKKHFKSHLYISRKLGYAKSKSFRFKRVKIFVGSVIFGFMHLAKFSFRGWKVYIERSILNFCLIFI